MSRDLLPADLSARMLLLAAQAASWQGQHDREIAKRLEESRALFQEAGDTGGEAEALWFLGFVTRNHGDYEAATAALEQALALYQARGDTNGIATVMSTLGYVALFQEDLSRAIALNDQALALYRATGNEGGVAGCFHTLGEAAHLQGDDERAAAFCREALALFRRLEIPIMAAWSLHDAGYVAERQGASLQAWVSFRESLALFQASATADGIGVCLAGFARLAVSAGQAERAACLLGAAEAVAARIGGLHFPMYRTERRRTVAMTRASLDERTFTGSWAEGQAMTLEQAIAYALEDVDRAKSWPLTGEQVG